MSAAVVGKCVWVHCSRAIECGIGGVRLEGVGKGVHLTASEVVGCECLALDIRTYVSGLVGKAY